MNLFKRFRDLIPTPPLLIGTVVDYAGGIATIEELGGGRSQARGEATVGDRVFFRAGAIEGPAPNLPVENIEL